MFGFLRKPGTAHSVLALVILALALLGFARHHPSAVVFNQTAYQLPDGTIAAICLGGDAEQQAAPDRCDACRLVETIFLPAQPAAPASRQQLVWLHKQPDLHDAPIVGPTSMPPPARAPPARV